METIATSTPRYNYQPQMFPSNAPDAVLLAHAEKHLFGDISPKHDFPSFFHISPIIDSLPRDHDLLPAPMSQPILTVTSVPETVTDPEVSNKVPQKDVAGLGSAHNSNSSSACLATVKKRGTKKDRHSKIFTAHGPRDRRVRLSLEIARKFFDLQDMLGYDKASKTVEWLLIKSKAAIKELARGFGQNKGCSSGVKSGSSISECEVVSGIGETIDNAEENKSKEKSEAANPRVKKIKQTRITTFHPLAIESRAQTRARARERTKEKLRRKILDQSKTRAEATPYNMETAEESGSHSHDKKSIVEESCSRSLENQRSVRDTPDDSLPIIYKPAPPSIFDYHPHIAISRGVNSEDLLSLPHNDMINNFPEIWDMDNSKTQSNSFVVPNIHLSVGGVQRVPCQVFKISSDVHPPSVQLMDAHFCAKTWEADNDRR